MDDLSQQVCIPCEGGASPLAPDQLEEYLGHVNNWKMDTTHTKISKRFAFKNFAQALDCVNTIGKIAESENHHPDIAFGWGYCEVTLTTHSICGLHPNDFIVASKIDQSIDA